MGHNPAQVCIYICVHARMCVYNCVTFIASCTEIEDTAWVACIQDFLNLNTPWSAKQKIYYFIATIQYNTLENIFVMISLKTWIFNLIY